MALTDIAIPTRSSIDDLFITPWEKTRIDMALIMAGIEDDMYSHYEYAYCFNCETVALQLVSELTGPHAASPYLFTCTHCEDEDASAFPNA